MQKEFAGSEKKALYAGRGENLRVTVSMGVAQYFSQEEITVLIKRTDPNTYTAKKEGKNRV